jgi:hypothetical protein
MAKSVAIQSYKSPKAEALGLSTPVMDPVIPKAGGSAIINKALMSSPGEIPQRSLSAVSTIFTPIEPPRPIAPASAPLLQDVLSPSEVIAATQTPRTPAAQAAAAPDSNVPTTKTTDMGFLNTIVSGIGKVVGGIAKKVKENKNNAIQVAALNLVNSNASKAQALVFPGTVAQQPTTAGSTASNAAFSTKSLNNIDYELSNKTSWYQQIPVWGWVVGAVVVIGTIIALIFKRR